MHHARPPYFALPTFTALLIGWCLSFGGVTLRAADFECIVLDEQFHSEGAAFADLDGDGHQDVVSGPFWYAGPDFRLRFRYMPGQPHRIKQYSDHFFSYVCDFNSDTYPDILVIGMPGTPAHWYRNPGFTTRETTGASRDSNWQRFQAAPDVGGESPAWRDLTGDGRPELICVHAGRFGYFSPQWDAPTAPWRFTSVSSPRSLGRFTHGLGTGDVNGDGRQDLLETAGWHLQNPDGSFKFHPAQHQHGKGFAQAGGAQMFAADFTGDGRADIVSVQNAHAWGLNWFQATGDESSPWLSHPILTAGQPANTPNGATSSLKLSQMHALAIADMDGDGHLDLITGKRFYAHGGGDPGAYQLPALYWFRQTRAADGQVRFEPHMIHPRIGVGTQLTVGDINNDERPDIVVGNKLGTFVLINRLPAARVAADAKHTASFAPNESTTEAASSSSRQNTPSPGSAEFSLGVRESRPLTAVEEQATFVLPPGFSVNLVASEPDIAKPMNMAFDQRGRLWVTTTVEYPYPVPVDQAGRDRVQVLEDTNGDGRADKITTFADGLNIPIGLLPYRDGVICYSIPNIWFLRDTDGDGVCDRREILYGPFDHTRDTHGMCNAFTRGYDGWIYACHGFNNQSRVSGKDGHVVEMHSGNTFRFRPDGSRIEHYTHGQVNPFGMAFDAAGDLFTADCHTKPVTLLLPGGYYDSFGKPHDGLGFVPDLMKHLHGSTAIGGLAISHAQSALPKAYHHSAWGGNVMTSRINRNRLVYRDGSVQAVEEPDFLISGDSWFRPVDLTFGPDGALYVADFYNRIIGHYEVPLEHPGRDRKRGRIWRISYQGKQGDTREVPTSALASPAVATDSTGNPTQGKNDLATRLVEQLRSESHTARMLAAAELVDQVPAAAACRAARRGLADSNARVRAMCMWVLAQRRALKSAELESAIRDKNWLVRCHAQRLLADASLLPDDVADDRLLNWLQHGLRDADPRVRRASAGSLSQRQVAGTASELLQCWDTADTNDVHLQHAIKIALKQQWNDSTEFARWAEAAEAGTLPADRAANAAMVCLALPYPHAAHFVAAHLPDLADRRTPDEVQAAVQHAANYADATGPGESALLKIIQFARRHYHDDTSLQVKLAQAMVDGCRRSKRDLPAALREWGESLARRLFAFDERQTPIPWYAHHVHGSANATEPAKRWPVSRSRNAADGVSGAALWSSFPLGEQATGVWRSGVFSLTDEFSCWIAGHDGYPNQPIRRKSWVQLRHARTHEVLAQWEPPRNDVAQRFSWTPPTAANGDTQTTPAYVQLVDDNPEAAFAWLAAGRFSVSGLNPSDQNRQRKQAAKLFGEMRLLSLVPEVADLLRSGSELPSTAAICEALVQFRPTSLGRVAAEGIDMVSEQPAVRSAMLEWLIANANANAAGATRGQAPTVPAARGNDSPPTPIWLAPLMQAASSQQQSRLAIRLASDREGVRRLLTLIRQGTLGSHVLRQATLADRLKATAAGQDRSTLESLLEEAGSETMKQRLAELAARREYYLSHQANATNGAAQFRQHCAACHQVAGEGGRVGPNLDGIGKRGLQRLLEDILLPNQNVDAAFRAATLITDDGQLLTGLLQSSSPQEHVLVDQQGKANRIPSERVELIRHSRLSPMPDNFAETLSAQQLADLLKYLLTAH